MTTSSASRPSTSSRTTASRPSTPGSRAGKEDDMKKIVMTILALAFVCVGLGLGQAKHPSELKYPSLKYEPPDPKAFRVEYAGGLRAYVQEDRSLPLFNITAIVNCGGLS